jgi:hypothetical protein
MPPSTVKDKLGLAFEKEFKNDRKILNRLR